ncbi:Putative amino acid permease [Mycobacteroides abscessus]|nr:Putative amino acid permease [Mycobacteroides abscessus]
MNFILLTAALSSCNSGIYSTGRMVRSLAQRGDAPAGLQALSSRHVPMLAICFSALAMGIGVFVNWLSPDKAFAYITSVSTIGIIFVWGSILVSHMIYRKRVADGLLPASDYKLPGAPVTNVLALGFLALVVLLLFFTEDGRTAVLVGVVWFIIVVLGYFVHHGEPAHRETQDA